MPENYEPIPQSGSDVALGETSTVDAAKHEAADLKDTAVEQAKDVAATVKDEASVVLGEAKSQAKDLYAQTQQELKEQANTQQQRIAAGLKSVGAELRAMAANSASSANSGVATDIVQQLSGRLSGAATWLGDRDAGAVLTEVKRYARRKPGTFIIGAAIAGIAFGRLTRALAANAAADSEAAAARTNAAARTSPPAVDAWRTPSATTPAVTIAEGETPLYAQSTAAYGDALRSEGGRDDRSDTF